MSFIINRRALLATAGFGIGGLLLPGGAAMAQALLGLVDALRGGKDIALSALTRQLRARALLVMGDDATDVAMFRAALSLAQTERVHVMLVGVSGGAETPPEITELSDVVVRSTEEALEGLETVARALGV